MGNGTGITGLVLSVIAVDLVIILLLANIIGRMEELMYGMYFTFSNSLTLALILIPILPVIGIILSIVSIAKNDSKAPGIVGLIFGLIGIVLAIVSIFLSAYVQTVMMMLKYSL